MATLGTFALEKRLSEALSVYVNELVYKGNAQEQQTCYVRKPINAMKLAVHHYLPYLNVKESDSVKTAEDALQLCTLCAHEHTIANRIFGDQKT